MVPQLFVSAPDRAHSPAFSLACADAGAGGAGPALVVLPGGPGLASVVPYLRVRRRLTAAGFRVLMPEHILDAWAEGVDVRDYPRSSFWRGEGAETGPIAELVRDLAARGLATDEQLSSIVPMVYEMGGTPATVNVLRKVAAGNTGTSRQLARLGGKESGGGRTPFVYDGDPALAILLRELEEVIDRFAAHGQTTTSIVQSSPVAGRGLALARPADGHPRP